MLIGIQKVLIQNYLMSKDMILGLYPYFYAFIQSYMILNLYTETIQGMMYILGIGNVDRRTLNKMGQKQRNGEEWKNKSMNRVDTIKASREVACTWINLLDLNR